MTTPVDQTGGKRTRPGNYPRRTYTIAETKALDGKAGRIHAIVSTETRDRQGDIIRQDGWDVDNFMKHPALLVNHDYHDVRAQVGEWEDMAVKDKKLHGVTQYYVGEGNEQADWAYNLAKKGRASFSVGFIPDMNKAVIQEGGSEWFGPWEFNGQELLEVSHVTIPANPDALQTLRLAGLDPEEIKAALKTLFASEAQTAVQDAIARQVNTQRIAEQIVQAMRRF